MIKTVPSIPQADLLLHSLRSVGYSEEAAVADIVDNAISAFASEIYIKFDWEKQVISIIDNGEGMEKEELYKNMQIGSVAPGAVRLSTDLGRFGLGMKTAAFSLGRHVAVASAKGGNISNAVWDLDQVNKLGWQLIVEEDEKYDRYLHGIGDHGTAVIISTLDNLIDKSDLKKAKSHFFSVINKVEKHLRLIFHRFIEEDGLKIYVNNDTPIAAWDPFILHNPATQELPECEIWDPKFKTCTYIQPYVLPHKTKFESEQVYDAAGGFKGWNRHQGIYLYRNRRLIIYGTWFELIRKEPGFNLARIRIDISAEADEDWKIDIKKSRAALPFFLRDQVLATVGDCTARSAKVFNSRGAYVKKGLTVPNLDYVWEQIRNNGNYSFKINKKHTILNSIRKQLDDEGRNLLRAYLSLVENFAPFMRNCVIDTINTGEAKQNDLQKQKDIADIKKFALAFKGQGFDKREIMETLLSMSIYSYLQENIIEIVEALDD